MKFGDVVRDVKVTVDPETSGLERYVAGEHMNTDDLHIRRWGTVGDGYLGPAFHRKFVKGQVLYGSRRTYLRKVAVAEFDGICANTTFVLEPRGDDLLPELLPFIMQTESFSTHAVKQSRGSVNPYVNFRDIAWYEFPLPPKDEQHRIADILWTADKENFNLKDALHKLDTLKSVTLRKITSDGLSSTENTKDTRIGTIPSYWRVLSVGDVVTVCQYGLSVPVKDTGQFPIFRMMNLVDGVVVENDMKYVDLSRKDMDLYRLETGDILFNRTNSADLVGKVGIYRLDGTHVFASYLVRLRADMKIILPEYLNYYLNSEAGQTRILMHATPGVSQSNINASNLKTVLVPVPPIKEQEQIIGILQRIDSSKEALRQRISSAERLRVSLLSRLLDGN